MMQSSDEDYRAYLQEFEACYSRIGGGKIALDSTCLRSLIRRRPTAARDDVAIRCFAAASQPGYLQPAWLIALAYEIEFHDSSLVHTVSERAKELGVEQSLYGG